MASRCINNERKACDAVARSLEDLLKAKRTNAYSPEDVKVGPPVEYVFDLGQIRCAIEHTVVEAFDGQIHTDIDFTSFVTPITAALDYNLPAPGKYLLAFAIHPSSGIKKRQIPTVQEKIIEWVKKSAAELHAECAQQPGRAEKPFGHRALRRDSIYGVELQLSRETGWYMPENAKGRLFPFRIAPADYENRRRERLQKAMAKKLPKLQSWKNNGARSVLVLENRDIALSNHVVILEAAEHALQERMDPPDEIWLVDTTIKEWTVWCLIRDGIPLPDEHTSVRFRDFDPCDLVEV